MAKMILKYLRKTIDYMLVCGTKDLILTGYTDFNFQTDKDSRKSTSGSGLDHVKILAKEAVWLKKFLHDLEVVPNMNLSITLYCDNSERIANSKKPSSHKRGKHTEMKYHLIREIVQRGNVIVTKIALKYNTVDPFTKTLMTKVFKIHLKSLALITKQAPLLRDFERAEIAVLVGEVTSQLAQLSVQPTLRQRIIVAQLNDPYLVEKRRLVETGQGEDFSISSNDGLTFERRLCVLEDSAVKTELLTEAHSSPFTITLEMKAPRQRPAGLLQPLSVPGWKWESVSMDFITGLPRTLKGYTVIWVVIDRLTKSAHFVSGKSTYTAKRDARFTSKFWKGLQLALGTRLDFSKAFHPQPDGSWDSYLHLMEFAYNNSYQATIGMAPFEALYGKCCRSLVYWSEVGEQRMLGPELVQTTNAAIQKIRARMLIAQSRQKSYADVRRKDLEFEVEDMVFLKVAPMKGVLRFEKKGKLSPRFIGPFEILERIGPVAYRLALHPSFSAVHDVFHVSMLRRYVADPTHVVDFEPLQISENLSYEEQPVEILARKVKKLRSREISLVKVLWRNHGVEEATWEREEDMRAQYPELFAD
ncbi:pol protein [Cucumis melo var. makuwa]|uniref:Pol protein n=1 Tax=Cucumis melo var. makuwa TaxID=1194695 RepID=A0A5D3E6D2_CUCMM|nr:pol protein [Cucumis melo var. makuwa]TYK31633.1 pol protein [Cucumis melo var. makuwa]